MTQRKKIDVILLCGGKGERLRPYTANLPKPLLKVNNKPFLYYIINKFLKINVNQIILASGYKSTKVSSFVNKYFKHNDKIKLVDSGNVDIIKRLYMPLNLQTIIDYYLELTHQSDENYKRHLRAEACGGDRLISALSAWNLPKCFSQNGLARGGNPFRTHDQIHVRAADDDDTRPHAGLIVGTCWALPASWSSPPSALATSASTRVTTWPCATALPMHTTG
jgi:hypothetical protein